MVRRVQLQLLLAARERLVLAYELRLLKEALEEASRARCAERRGCDAAGGAKRQGTSCGSSQQRGGGRHEGSQ